MWKILLLLSVLSINKVLAQGPRYQYNCYSLTWSEVVNVTSTEVTVRWECCNSRSKPSYKLQMTSSFTTCDCDFVTSSMTSGCFHTFSNLCSDTIYKFTVSNHKPAEEGNRAHIYNSEYYNFQENSRTITLQTQPSTPGNVAMNESKAISDTAVNLTWEHNCPNGKVTYNVTWSPDDGILLTQELELTVADLTPATLYTFLITACNVINSSICSHSSTLVKTFPGDPSEPTTLEAVDVSSSDVHLRWNHPENPKGPIDGYEIVCRPESNATLAWISKLINKMEEHLVTGLEPWTNYSCSIQAFNLLDVNKITGNRSDLTIFTKPARPDEPQSLEMVDKRSDEIFLTWKHPSAPRGPIDGYVVRASNGKTETQSITSSEEFCLSGLNSWTRYNITVHAFNLDGNDNLEGMMANISVKTRPAKPSAPRDVKAVRTIAGETYLKWKRPLFPNGPIDGYHIKNLNDESEVFLPASVLEHHLNTLIPDTNYTFSVCAYNVDVMERLDGKAASVNHTTNPEGEYITERAVAEMINLLRKDLIREFSKTQAMMRRMLRSFVEESDAPDQKHFNKSFPETAPEYRTLNGA